MSVTFSAASNDRSRYTGYQVECADGQFRDDRTWPFGTDGYAEAGPAVALHGSFCDQEDCQFYGGSLHITVTPGTEWMDEGVNLSQSNARAVLTLLDLHDPIDGDMSGTATAADLRARIAAVRARNLPDLGRPEQDQTVMVEVDMADGTTRTVQQGPTWIDCGRDAGYIEDRLAQIDAIAARCETAGVDVGWS